MQVSGLPKRDAISPVKRLTNSVENSLAIGASVQDATMHAPFAALVQSKVQKSYIFPYAAVTSYLRRVIRSAHSRAGADPRRLPPNR